MTWSRRRAKVSVPLTGAPFQIDVVQVDRDGTKGVCIPASICSRRAANESPPMFMLTLVGSYIGVFILSGNGLHILSRGPLELNGLGLAGQSRKYCVSLQLSSGIPLTLTRGVPLSGQTYHPVSSPMVLAPE